MLAKSLIKIACETNFEAARVMLRLQTQQIENTDVV